MKKFEYNGYIFEINDDNSIKSITETEKTKKTLKEQANLCISKKDEFIQRGKQIIKKRNIKNWVDFVNHALDNKLFDDNDIRYRGAIVEASIQCMEKLSQGLSVEEAYETIDIQNNNCVFFEGELSGEQNRIISSIVSAFHKKGDEFLDYRNSFVKNPKTKIKK